MNIHKTGIHPAIRRLHVGDKSDVFGHFMRLDAQSRRDRFCGTVSDSEVEKYVKDIFCHDSIICGAFIDGQLRGVAELRGVFYARPAATEIAFSVEQDWQNIGVGDALFERIFAIAQNRGVRTLHLMCLRQNNRMKHIAIKHDAELSYGPDGIEAVLHPKSPNPFSMAKEVIGETSGYAQSLFGWSGQRFADLRQRAMSGVGRLPIT